jgi:transcriptional regulator with XRE-family HTH domain
MQIFLTKNRILLRIDIFFLIIDMFMANLNPLTERVQLALRSLNISVNALAKSSGISQTTLNQQINGTVKMGMAVITSLLDYSTNLSAEWLLRGEGDMLKADTTPLPLAEDTEKLRCSYEEEIIKLRDKLEEHKEFNALQREYVTELKKEISGYEDRVAELKDHINDLKKAQHSASVHRAANA